jgi:hypothetical protein
MSNYEKYVGEEIFDEGENNITELYGPVLSEFNNNLLQSLFLQTKRRSQKASRISPRKIPRTYRPQRNREWYQLQKKNTQ